MGPKDVILKNLEMSDVIIKKYLDDLSDADLRLEGVPGMHSIAVQLGHLISGERMMVEFVSPGLSPELPAGFDDAHSLKGEVTDRKLASKDEYVKLWEAQRGHQEIACECERCRAGGHARRQVAGMGADGWRYAEHGGPSPGHAFRPICRGATAVEEGDCVLRHSRRASPKRFTHSRFTVSATLGTIDLVTNHLGA